MSKKMTPIRKTFDRDYDLSEESPPDIHLPWGHSLIRFESKSCQCAPLVLMHVCEHTHHDRGEALCGESGTIGQEMRALCATTRYPFCRPCQEAAASKEEG